MLETMQFSEKSRVGTKISMISTIYIMIVS